MLIDKLQVSALRNLDSIKLDLIPNFNVFCGENGSGKTSILESVYMLGFGRSFRTSYTKQLINFKKKSCIVFGEVNARSLDERIKLGVERELSGGVKIKVAEKDGCSVSELAKCLPLQLINQDTYLIIEGGSEERRSFIDWILFHVEPLFYSKWQQYKRLLKQRNAGLKQLKFGSRFDISLWNRELAQVGEEITNMRVNCLSQLESVFHVEHEENLKLGKVIVEYLPGFDKETGLLDSIERSFEHDISLGYTTSGPHRADILFKINEIPAKALLSRGQMKLFICMLLVARAKVLGINRKGIKNIFLIDDLLAELDEKAAMHLINELEMFNCQVLVTGIEAEPLIRLLSGCDSKIFQMQNGYIKS